LARPVVDRVKLPARDESTDPEDGDPELSSRVERAHPFVAAHSAGPVQGPAVSGVLPFDRLLMPALGC